MRATVVRLLVLWVLVLPLGAGASEPPRAREGAAHSVPLYGNLLRPYDADENPYSPGHRGVDVEAGAGSEVRSSADGIVSFSGSVAGNLSVSVDHGQGLLTTYSYLSGSAVAVGQAVQRGTVLGWVGQGHPGSGLGPHVHLSARQDGVYFDPLSLYVGTGHADLVSLVR